jgi:Protein of unknown function (DUF3124)
MPGRDEVRMFRLIPVPMHLDDPRWRKSWRQKPCLVFHLTEEQARETAAQFFKATLIGSGARAGFPWNDPELVVCHEDSVPESMRSGAEPGTVRDLSRGVIDEAQLRSREDGMNARTLLATVVLLLGCGLFVWSTSGHHIQLAHVRQQARAVLALQSGAERENHSDPLHAFRESLAEVSPMEAKVRRTVYVPAYSAIRVMSGRGRINLATTLSIHNTSGEKPLVLERVDYHNTHGELVQAHLERAVVLKPLGTIEMFVAHEDLRGGTGANFVIDWAADGPISEPVVEAVMMGVWGTTSYSFVSQGRTATIVGSIE